MARTPALYRLWNRSGIFYYRLRGWSTWRTTGCDSKQDALDFIAEKLHELPPEPRRAAPGRKVSLKRYLEPFYTDECPHVQRLRTEGKSIGSYHIHACRQLIQNKINPDSISEIMVQDLRRADILDFRNRLAAKYGPSVVNRTIMVLKTALKEGLYREELQRDPSAGIGNIKYQLRESGTFTEEEIVRMFGECPGPWISDKAYTYFLLLFTTGIRRGEGLALTWGSVDFEHSVIYIRQTLLNDGRITPPKWGKTRETPLPEFTATALKTWRAKSLHVLPDSFVFSRPNGDPHKASWTHYCFHTAMRTLGIDARARQLRVHSLRHSSHSVLLAKGVSPELLRAAFGWSDIAVQRGYSHLSGQDLQGQARVIDGLFKG
ncbi:MAG: site-specific integrase [Spirochaetales bacterium]|nr:site-specific integrase [Spirochaetales bacterium]